MKSSLAWLVALGGLVADAKKPNILFILTDDQDWHMESVHHMQYLKSDIINHGSTYSKHFCTVALCCPSRATLWTGRAAHNHNITYVEPPFGGYPKVARLGINDDYLPVWMQRAGYNTYYAGKLWNAHTVYNYDDPLVKGYNSSDFLLDPFTYQYWNTAWTHNGETPVHYPGQYSTDILAEKSYALLDEALSHEGQPWFLTVAPTAPHSNLVVDATTGESYLGAPKAADRHRHLFSDYKIPRGQSFNKPIEGGAGWLGRMSELNETVVEYNDEFQRQRLRALQPVDEMVHEFIKKLEAAGELQNTFVFYTTDNGYHISQHGMHPGKECGYDTDIRIPLFVRGPGIEPGSQFDTVTTHTDLAPTLLRLAGAERQLDGQAIPLGQDGEESDEHKSEYAAVEYWGFGLPEGYYGFRQHKDPSSGDTIYKGTYENNTYKGLRMVGHGFSLYYSVWCTGETELFDLTTDPEQTTNLLSPSSSFSPTTTTTTTFTLPLSGRYRYSIPIEPLTHRLDALLMVLRGCKDETCTRPWKVLHPSGDVTCLSHALDAKFDEFYAEQPRMWFRSCEGGFLPEAESDEEVGHFVVDVDDLGEEEL